MPGRAPGCGTGPRPRRRPEIRAVEQIGRWPIRPIRVNSDAAPGPTESRRRHLDPHLRRRSRTRSDPAPVAHRPPGRWRGREEDRRETQPPDFASPLWIVLAGWAGSSGCIHNHYYYGPSPAAARPACRVDPGRLGLRGPRRPGGRLRTPSERVTPGSAAMVAGPQPSSAAGREQPAAAEWSSASPPTARRSARRQAGRKWRRPDPEALATTRVEGASTAGLDPPVTRGRASHDAAPKTRSTGPAAWSPAPPRASAGRSPSTSSATGPASS